MVIACVTTLTLVPRLNHMHGHSRVVLQLLAVSVSVVRLRHRLWMELLEEERERVRVLEFGVGCPATEMLHAESPRRAPVHVIEAVEDRLMSSSDKLFHVSEVVNGCSGTSLWLRVSDCCPRQLVLGNGPDAGLDKVADCYTRGEVWCVGVPWKVTHVMTHCLLLLYGRSNPLAVQLGRCPLRVVVRACMGTGQLSSHRRVRSHRAPGDTSVF